jgi:hypothetical protein
MLIDLRNLKRKLEVDAEIERTGSPELWQSASTSSGQSALATALAALLPPLRHVSRINNTSSSQRLPWLSLYHLALAFICMLRNGI